MIMRGIDKEQIIIQANGHLFSWGGGGNSYNHGQLGQGHWKDQGLAKPIKFFR